MLKRTLLGLSIALAGIGAASAETPAAAPAPSAIKRTPLQKVENYPAGYNIVTVVGEIAPGGSAGRHTHPGVDSGYVLEGGRHLFDRRNARPRREAPAIPGPFQPVSSMM